MRKIFVFTVVAGVAAFVVASCGSKRKSDVSLLPRDSTYTSVKHPEWSRNAVIYEVNLRQYSEKGDLDGFEAELPRIKELGADILWFMPVHPISEKGRKGELGSYYAVRDYKAFNPEFGTIDGFKALVKKIHGMGMKVIIDWVPNHTGQDNVWVEEHPEWYVRDSTGGFVSPYDWTDVYKLDYGNKEMRAAMVDALKFWIEEVGVDGFRCDVAGEVPTDFWDEARPKLQESNDELFMLAEASKPELQVNGFDMGYNWPMKDLFNAIAATAGQNSYKKADGTAVEYPEKHAIDIDTLLALQSLQYPADTYLMNMVTNHDLNSWEGTEFDRYGNLADAMAVLSYTLPGMPLIYTGQETGLNRALEFFKKDVPPVWDPRNRYFEFYQKLNHLKHTQPALQAGVDGGVVVRYPTESDDLYIFSRTVDNATVFVFANLGPEPREIKYTGDVPGGNSTTVDFFDSTKTEFPVALNPGEYRVFVNR